MLDLGLQEWEDNLLVSLDLSSTNISSIPKEIENLVSLKNLNLGFNQIEQIPEEVGYLDQLEYLSLNYA